jgi:glycosyltransferase involved in cell wall biosynthesis
MQLSLSVILCTYNPRSTYMRRTLDSLKAQTLPLDQWELLLVDNASTERLADHWDLTWHPHSRHVREDELGLTPARLRGIRESKGGLVVFVDDDNVLAPDYLEIALAIPRRYPYLGVFGAGNLEPEFEVQPAPELVTSFPMLAPRTVPTALWSNNPKDFSCIPWGAGLCATREVADQYLDLVRSLDATKLIDRRGEHLFSGGDDLFSWASVCRGRGFGLFPELRLTHVIFAKRVSRPYLLNFIHDHRFSHGVLGYLLSIAEPKRIDLFCIAKVILHGLRNGRFLMQCMWASARGEEQAERLIAKTGLRPLKLKKGTAAESNTWENHNTNQSF